MELISLKRDYAFRELFSHENVRKQFLSDVLGIPLENIKSVKIANSWLWKRLAWQKQGILDMALEMNDGTKVNIEMQVKQQKNWIRRKLFYLAKLYTEDLRVGQHYDRLCKCISISIVDFALVKGAKYHSEYRLRDRDGMELTDLLELHIIELRKPLQGTDVVNDWIRLFNAEKTEDLDMIRTQNKGMTEAIEVLKEMSLGRTLRQIYEYRMKIIRDRKAEDEYVWDQGKAEGKAEDILVLLGEIGDIPSDLCEKIKAEKNLNVLNIWLKTAARAESISQFRERCGL